MSGFFQAFEVERPNMSVEIFQLIWSSYDTMGENVVVLYGVMSTRAP
jgi:hypothetical protein